MMPVTVAAFSAFGLKVSETKTEAVCLQKKYGGKVSFTVAAAGQEYKHRAAFVYSGKAISADRKLSVDITHRVQRAWAGFRRYNVETYGRSCVSLRPKVRMLNADVIETLLYKGVTWSPNKPEYERLRQTHHSMLLHCLGWRKRKRDDHTLSYANIIAKTVSESIGTMATKRRMSLAGFLAHMWRVVCHEG